MKEITRFFPPFAAKIIRQQSRFTAAASKGENNRHTTTDMCPREYLGLLQDGDIFIKRSAAKRKTKSDNEKLASESGFLLLLLVVKCLGILSFGGYIFGGALQSRTRL